MTLFMTVVKLMSSVQTPRNEIRSLPLAPVVVDGGFMCELWTMVVPCVQLHEVRMDWLRMESRGHNLL